MKAMPDDSVAVRGRIDRDGRLIAADPQLLALHHRAGGLPGGIVAVPQIAAVARLTRRLGNVVSRGIVAADGDEDLDLWIRAQPDGDAVDIAVAGWARQPAAEPAPEPEREHDFLRASADWTWATDGALRLLPFDAEAEAAIGEGAAALAGLPLTRLFSLVAGAEGTLPLVEALAERTSFDEQFAELRAAPGRRLRLAGVPMLDEAGQFAGFRGTATRVDEDELPAFPLTNGAFGERLDRALRMPLDRIITSAETIRSQNDGPLRRGYVDYASDIAGAGRHLLAMVDDLVDMQAIERADFHPRCEPLNLADVARRAAGLLAGRAAERDIVIDRPEPEALLIAIGDFRRTLQILVNLIGNAVRYSPDGGTVSVRCERHGPNAAAIVADLGKGIAAEDQARIFDKFERVDPAEPGGTGLGLYIARRLARAMDGDIAVDSTPGKGARFVLSLPVSRAG